MTAPHGAVFPQRVQRHGSRPALFMRHLGENSFSMVVLAYRAAMGPPTAIAAAHGSMTEAGYASTRRLHRHLAHFTPWRLILRRAASFFSAAQPQAAGTPVDVTAVRLRAVERGRCGSSR